MKWLTVAAMLAASQVASLAQYSFSTDFSQNQDFTQGVGSTGWLGAYGGNNPSSTFAASGGHLTMNDTGGHWEGGLTSGHLLYVSVTGNFTMQCLLSSLNNAQYNTAGIGAFDPSVITASPTATWIGLMDLSFVSAGNAYLDTRSVVNSTESNDPNVAPNVAMPVYLQMTRVGDMFTQSYSTDGTHFTQLGSIEMSSLPETLDVGLWDGSYTGGTANAVFNSFSVTANPVPEPGTCALAGLGIIGLLALRRKK
jgi:hypothetical protein